MFSHTELQHILEKAFEPTLCKCTISHEGMMTLELLDPQSHAQVLKVPNIAVSGLVGGRALAALVRGIKEQLGHPGAGSEMLKRRY